MKDKELKKWREEKVADYKHNHELITKNFSSLCKLLQSVKGQTNVETPYGSIFFSHDNAPFAYVSTMNYKTTKQTK